MAKITRKTQKIFAVNANSNELAVFGSLKAGTPTYSSDPDSIQSAEYLAGLFGAVVGDNSPAIEDHNSLFYLFARQLAYLFQQGISEWDSATEYHIGSFCSISTEVGKVFVSKIDTNVNHSPTGTNWQLYWYSYDLNKLEKYTPFCVNSGNTDVNGNGDLVGFTGNTLNFKIGGSYVNMGLTTANGTHFEISSIANIDFSSAGNGTYYFYIYPDGTVIYRATDLHRQRAVPSLPFSDFTGWLDTSKEQLNFYFLRNGVPPGAIIFGNSLDCVPFAKVVKTGGNIVSVETLPFNYNGYNANRYSSDLFSPAYSSGVSKSTSGFTADANGLIYIEASGGDNQSAYLVINGESFCVFSVVGATLTNSLSKPISVGDVISITKTASATINKFRFYPYKGNL